MNRVATLLLVPLLLGCGDPGDDSHDFEVALVGDSIVARPGFADAVVEEFPPFEVQRTTFGGLTTRSWDPEGDLYQRFYSPSQNPRVAVILLGTNDANIFHRIPVEEYIDNLVAIAEAFIDLGTDVVILMTPPRNFQNPPVHEGVHTRLEQYAIAIEWLCLPPGDQIECGPDLYSTLVESDFEDGIHPNQNGHAWIFAELLPML